MRNQGLDAYLRDWAGDDTLRRDVAALIDRLADAIVGIAELVADGPLAGDLGAAMTENVQGEVQKALDAHADRVMGEACLAAPVAAFASEERDHPTVANPGAPLLVAFDPLDGSSNIDTNVSVGTILAVMRAADDVAAGHAAGDDLADHAAFLVRGRDLLAAAYAIYGPQTALVLSLGAGTAVFTLDRRARSFRLTTPAALVPPTTREFAINASNSRHWDEPISAYVDDLISGREGPRGRDFNMRWVASLVAECHRILVRGGVFLYPGDRRDGYAEGRLRLLYEANPIAFLIEQAGGASTTGTGSILDLEPAALHQRVPFLFGSREEIAEIERRHLDPQPRPVQSPLFSRRGLFRE